MPLFTFHSGYILMDVLWALRSGQNKFTFHSGYILIYFCNFFFNLKHIYIPLWLYSYRNSKLYVWELYKFTFHSGYILIHAVSIIVIYGNIFTFHSGYILIVQMHSKYFFAFSFTFHSGYILIPTTKEVM